MSYSKQKLSAEHYRKFASTMAAALLVLVGVGDHQSLGATTATPINISQVPLTIPMPAHPQVMIAMGNSESMDGNLSGAIMTGSGALGASLSELQNSSSPLNFVVPNSFAPPVTGGAAGSSQPYTSTVSGNLVDNSPSRLNVAKQGLQAILSTFLPNTDFAFMDYQTSGVGLYSTWVYYMSAAGSNFSFTSSAGANTVANPCYGITITGGGLDTIQSQCKNLNALYTGGVTSLPYLVVGNNSDDPAINDVLYSNGTGALCLVYGAVSPTSPYTSNYGYGSPLQAYNNQAVLESYPSQINSCAPVTGPTNAGFVPFSPQVMYAQRGFGYLANSSATTGNVLVTMKSAGATPTTASVSTALAYFTPYLMPETNNTNTTEIKASTVQSPTPGLLAGAYSYFSNNAPPSSNGCTPQRYVLLITDGLPTTDLNGKIWPPLGSSAATGFGVTATFNADGSLNTTNDQALTDTISKLQALNSAGIKTYVIGLGAGVDPTKNPAAANTLNAMAVAGGTAQNVSPGSPMYYPATSPTDLVNDLQSIMATIAAATEAISASAVNTTYISSKSVVYQAQFSTSDSNQDWTGNLYAFPIDSTTGQVNTSPSAAKWNAQGLLDAKNWDTERTIATWDPVAKSGIPFRWSTGTTGISSSTTLGTQLSSNTADANGQHALEYLRGNRSWEKSSGGSYRSRAHVLGDIVDSSPVYVAGPVGAFFDTSYTAFIKARAARQPMVYVGSNDGMLHAFNATTGQEKFAYIPNGVFSNLIKLTSLFYNQQHQFFVDGSPSVGDVQFANASWHTILVGGENAGGKSVYALDITDPASITTESGLATKVLWEFTDTDMGYSFGMPAMDRTNAGFKVLFGNGYNSPNQKPFLYAVDAQTGSITNGVKIDLCALVVAACDLTKPNGLSSITLTNSSGALGSPSTIAYAGDLQGNLWRVDISNSSPSNWTVSWLFKATDSSGKTQPITTTPVVTLNPRYPLLLGNMVFVGTGQMLSIADLGSTQVQSMYGVYDDGTASVSSITRGSLVQQTFSATTAPIAGGGGTTISARTLTGNPVDLTTKKGWYVDFSLLTGERIVTNPALDIGAVIATSNQPSSNTCTAGNVAWLNLFNYATGGKFQTPQLQITPTAVNGISLGSGYATAPTVAIDGKSRLILFNDSLEGGTGQPKTESQGKVGLATPRSAWWEKR